MFKKSLETLIRALCLRGEKFSEEKRYEEALNVFQEARALSPGFFDVHVLLADVFMRTGKYEEALKNLRCAEELFELSLVSPEAREESIGQILEKAEKAYFRLSGSPYPSGSPVKGIGDSWKNPKIYYCFAICYKNLGEAEKGLGFLKKAAKEIYEELNNPERRPDGSLFSGAGLFEGPGKTFKEAETLEAAGMPVEAFNLLCPLIRERIMEKHKIEGAAAGR